MGTLPVWVRLSSVSRYDLVLISSVLRYSFPAGLPSAQPQVSERTQGRQIVSQGEIRDGCVLRISHVLSARKSIIPFSLRKRIIQQTDNIDFYPFLHCNLRMTV